MQSDPMRTLLGLLKLIHSSGGEVEGRVRLQKAAFLLGSKGIAYFDPKEFVYHHHGPYSRLLSDTLHQAVSFGLVEERRESFSDDMERYAYRLTDGGRKFLSDIPAGEDADISAIAAPMSRFHWRSLELAATIAFLEQHGDARNRPDAVEMAVDLKPACSKYADEAEKLLGAVGL
jgi:uncharacterized protein